MDEDEATIDALLEAIAEAPGVRIVGVKCLQASPLLVSINGTGSVPAEALAGHVFAVDDTGRALWSPPSKPICLKVT